MSEDQLQPQDSLDDRGVDDVLDEGFSPPERPRGVTAKGVTPLEEIEGETLDERLAQEEPDVFEQVDAERDAEVLDGPVSGEVGDERSGRLIAPDQGLGEAVTSALIDEAAGIEVAGAHAEEAARPEGAEGGAKTPCDSEGKQEGT